MLKKILANPLLIQSLYSLIARFTGVALNFAVMILITQTLPKSSAGDILLLMTFVTGVALISRLGIDQLLMKEVASAHVNEGQFRQQFLSTSYKAVLILSLVFMAIWLLASPFLQYRFFQAGDLPTVTLTELMLASVGILFFNLVILNSTYLKAIKQSVMGVLGQNALTAITFLGFIAVFWSYFSNNQFTIYLYIGSLILAGILAVFITPRVASNNPVGESLATNTSAPNILALIQKSLPLAPISIISFLMIFTDTIMVGWFLANDRVAEYSVASKISYIVLFFLQAMEAVIYPRLLNMYQHDSARLQRFFWQATALVVGVVLIVSAFMYLLSDWLLIAFGKDYVVAKEALGLLLLAQFLRAASITFSFMFIIKEKVKYLNIILVTAFIANIIFNIILINRYGIEGAAIATLIANAVLLFLVLGLFFWNKLLNLKENIKP
ncbi:MAG TPA: polysaccharide biosynthesis protein [Leucothrix mucor]|nr:polysaccharide biosynthesis protein [Leucothrix mucor]